MSQATMCRQHSHPPLWQSKHLDVVSCPRAVYPVQKHPALPRILSVPIQQVASYTYNNPIKEVLFYLSYSGGHWGVKRFALSRSSPNPPSFRELVAHYTPVMPILWPRDRKERQQRWDGKGQYEIDHPLAGPQSPRTEGQIGMTPNPEVYKKSIVLKVMFAMKPSNSAQKYKRGTIEVARSIKCLPHSMET